MDKQVQHFLTFMSVEKGSATNTISAYRNDLEQFRVFVAARPSNGARPDWCDVNADLLQGYVAHLRDKEYADATVARKVAAVKSFFSYLTAEGIVPADPAESLSSPRGGEVTAEGPLGAGGRRAARAAAQTLNAGSEARQGDAGVALRHRNACQ